MRFIKKTSEPQYLIEFKSEFKKINKHSAVYDNINSDLKNNLKDTLSNEQYFICCYCMKRIKNDYSHIEHLKPQSDYLQDSLNYFNLLISCNGINNSNNNCGHKKGSWYDEKVFISPLDKDCEKYFSYSLSGKIDSSSDNGNKTIEKLNLNSYHLVRARKAMIDISGIFKPGFNQKMNDLIKYNTLPNSSNELPPFCNAVLYCISNYYKKN